MQSEIDVNCLQPLRDATDEKFYGERGGWERVLEYCSLQDRIHEALAINDFLIIQIDTDCGDHENYRIPLTINGNDRLVVDLINDAMTLLVSKISSEIYDLYRSRIIFAICVHSIECWILPLYAPFREASRVKSCEHHLGRALFRLRIANDKTYKNYCEILRPLNKRRNLELCRQTSESFNIFLDSLESKLAPT